MRSYTRGWGAGSAIKGTAAAITRVHVHTRGEGSGRGPLHEVAAGPLMPRHRSETSPACLVHPFLMVCRSPNLPTTDVRKPPSLQTPSAATISAASRPRAAHRNLAALALRATSPLSTQVWPHPSWQQSSGQILMVRSGNNLSIRPPHVFFRESHALMLAMPLSQALAIERHREHTDEAAPALRFSYFSRT